MNIKKELIQFGGFLAMAIALFIIKELVGIDTALIVALAWISSEQMNP